MKSGTTERGSDDVAMGNGTKREDVESERGAVAMRNGARERGCGE